MRVLKVLILALLACGLLQAQNSTESTTVVPQRMRFSSTIPNPERTRRLERITFAIFAENKGGGPLWNEEQDVLISPAGAFTVLLGASGSPLPVSLFSSGEARWIATLIGGQEIGPRSLFISVPYAMKASDADTLAGRPVSAFVTREEIGNNYSPSLPTTGTQERQLEMQAASVVNSASTLAGTGTAGFLPLWQDSNGTLGDSSLFQSGSGQFGIGTRAPAFNLHVISGTDPAAITVEGYGAVGINFIGRRAQGTQAAPKPLLAGDNIMAMQGRGFGATQFSATSRAAMKFFAAENWSDAAQGTFITLATTKRGTTATSERVRIDDAGNIGIGTGVPSQKLEVVGNIKISGGSLLFADGTSQHTASTSSGLTSADASLTIVNNQAKVSESGITSVHLANGSVNASKLDSALTATLLSAASLSANAFLGPQTMTLSDPAGAPIYAKNSADSGNAIAVMGETMSSAGTAVYASSTNSSSSGTGKAVYAISKAGRGTGLYGEAANTLGSNYGVWGHSRSSSGVGVYGQATSTGTGGVNSTKGVYGVVAGENGSAGVFGEASATNAQSIQYGVYGIARGTQGIGVYAEASTTLSTGLPVGVLGVARSTSAYAAQFYKYSKAGNVIAAYSATDSSSTPNLIMRLDGVGNLRTAGAISGNGADYAEMITTQTGSGSLEAGDVVVISEGADRSVELSAEPYSTRVIGVYSTQPGIIGRPNALTESSQREIPVAMIGIVPCKATAENGPIHRGDLVVTSSRPGHVMKATDRTRLTGAVVGKAMQVLESGTGVIQIAVTLQ